MELEDSALFKEKAMEDWRQLVSVKIVEDWCYVVAIVEELCCWSADHFGLEGCAWRRRGNVKIRFGISTLGKVVR
jgi:hypothetical protein